MSKPSITSILDVLFAQKTSNDHRRLHNYDQSSGTPSRQEATPNYWLPPGKLPRRRAIRVKLGGWFHLAGLLALLLVMSACTQAPISLGGATPTPTATSPSSTSIATPTPEKWPSPSWIENVKVEQSDDTFVVAIYLVDRDGHDTLGSGSALLEIVNEVTSDEHAEQCIKPGTHPRDCPLFEIEEQVTADGFHFEEWDEADCEPKDSNSTYCVGEHLTYRFEPLALTDALQPPVDERILFHVTFISSLGSLERYEYYHLKEGRFEAADVEDM